MRKVSVVFIALLLVAVFAFVGCAPASNGPSGAHTLKEITVAGQTMTVDQMQTLMESDSSYASMANILDVSLNFSGDKVSISGMGMSGEADYTLDGTTLTIVEGSTTLPCTYENDQITMEQAGVSMVFGK